MENLGESCFEIGRVVEGNKEVRNQMKIGILISGRGSNMTAIVEAVQSGQIPDSDVAVVISDKTGAEGLEKAKERGIETVVVTEKVVRAKNTMRKLSPN